MIPFVSSRTFRLNSVTLPYLLAPTTDLVAFICCADFLLRQRFIGDSLSNSLAYTLHFPRTSLIILSILTISRLCPTLPGLNDFIIPRVTFLPNPHGRLTLEA